MESSMQSAPGKGLLKVIGILMIIFGALAIVLAILAIVGFSLLAGAAGGAIAMVAMIFAFFPGILEFIVGIIGVKNCDKLENAKKCFVWGIIVVAVQVVSIILSAAGATFDWTSLIGLVLPVLFLIGATMNKNAAKA